MTERGEPVIGVLALEMRGQDEVVLMADPHILIVLGGFDYDAEITGDIVTFGTPGLGDGVITYTVGDWDDDARAWHATRLEQP